MNTKKAYNDAKIQKVTDEKARVEEDDQQRRIAFFAKTADCDDLNDHLQELVDHVAENTNATAVYLGKVTKPINGIAEGKLKEDDNDEAHVIPDA